MPRYQWFNGVIKIASPRSANPFDAFDDNGNLRGGSPPPAAPAGHISPAGRKALDAWTKCLDDAADSLIKQSETAPTVADAALYNCLNSEIAFSEATVKTGELSRDGFDTIKQIAKQRVIARVMAIRKTAKEVPSTRGFPANEAAAQNFDKWLDCTRTAIDALADQPEPAQTVAKAVVASCMIEQLAYQNSAGLSDRQMEADEAAIVASGVLARVMAVRAARAKLRKEDPETKPAIDYGRM
jgi:truncated hemoglobin YjbI